MKRLTGSKKAMLRCRPGHCLLVGVYIAKCILESYDRSDSFGYWSLTDWMGEAPLPESLFFGGLGLFTVGGIPKAAYHVFRMLRRLGDELLGQGPGWFVTAGDGGY